MSISHYSDVVLESIRAAVLFGLIVYLAIWGRRLHFARMPGASLIMLGFCLVFVGSLFDITDEIPGLDRYVIIGETLGEAVIEKIIGYLGGFLCLFAGFTRIIPEISRAEATEKALAMSEEHNRTILEALRAGVVMVDPAGTITVANRCMTELFGYSQAELVGRTYAELIDRDELSGDTHLELVGQILAGAGATISGECPYRRRDGSSFWGHLSGRRLDDGESQHSALLAVITDITDRKNLEHQALRAAQLAAVGELASGMAHEINNPVTGVINCAQLLLQRRAVAEEHQPVVHRIIREGDRIAAIVRSLLFFSRDPGHATQVVDVRELLADVLQLYSDQLLKDRIDLKIAWPESTALVDVNPQQIEQVLLNLISNSRHALNAIDDTATAEKILKITVELLQRQAGSICRISVYDNGTGIPEMLISRLGQPFVTTKPAGIGTGLGLSISQEIVRRHGGELHITSREGNFTEVAVELPAVPHAAPQ